MSAQTEQPKTSTLEQYYKDLATLDMSNDPLMWVMYCFEWGKGELAKFPNGPDKWQREQLNKIRAHLLSDNARKKVFRLAVASGNGIGKSALVSWLILWALTTYDDSKGVVTANTEVQLKTKTWAELAKWHRLCLVKDMLTLGATSIRSPLEKYSQTWKIDMVPWSEQNTEAFAGLHNQGKRLILIFDEASAIHDEIWNTAEGALTDNDTQIFWLAFGNPTRNVGKFNDCFGENSHRWETTQIDSRTVAISNKEQIQEWVDDKGEDDDFVKVHVRGMFPSQDDTQLIAVKDLDAAIKRKLTRNQFEFAPVIITCDPSWSGSDPLVIAVRQGLFFAVLRVIPKNDNDVLIAQILAGYEDEYGADAVIIDGGYGTGIQSAGKSMGRRWTLVFFNESSPDPSCMNLRAYMYKEVKEWLKQGGALPAEDQELYRELLSIRIKDQLSGKLQLESKKEMRARKAKSPNKADCFIAGTMVLTPKGEVPIETIKRGQEIVTPVGVRRVVFTQKQTVTTLTFAEFYDKINLIGKGNHRVFTWNRGWVTLSNLCADDVVETKERLILWKILKLFGMAEKRTGFKVLVDTLCQTNKLHRKDFFTAEYGPRIMEQYRKVMSSITLTATGLTTTLKTLLAFREGSTLQSICKNIMLSRKIKKQTDNNFMTCENLPQNGMVRQKVKSGILKTVKHCGKIKPLELQPVKLVEKYLKHGFRQEQSSVLMLANKKDHTQSIKQNLKYVLAVVKSFWRIATNQSPIVLKSVVTAPSPEVFVYNLTLDRDNVYYANGILVENCLALSFAIPVRSKKNRGGLIAGGHKSKVVNKFSPFIRR